MSNHSAVLALADGSVFYGTSIGIDGEAVGEVVFNTSMTGYQEILTDPSYAKQIVTLTYPHIGNTGVNSEDEESERVWAQGLVIRDLPLLASNFRNEKALDDYLRERKISAIADVDTRRLTRVLREKGAQSGCIMAKRSGITSDDAEQAMTLARSFKGLAGMDLAKEVTRSGVERWDAGSWQLGTGFKSPTAAADFKVVAYDFGVKRNILRILVDKGCELTVVPAKTPASEVLALNPDGVFLSNGPGDPEPCDYAIDAISKLLEQSIPLFGICLGHQLLALASGAKTKKMKFGHHGANHPVKDHDIGTVMITSQNHGFAVDEAALPDCLRVTHSSLFDGSLQGVAHTNKPAFGFQGHPEASPGPHDAAHLFDRFIDAMRKRKTA